MAARWLNREVSTAHPSPRLSLIDVPPGFRAKLANYSRFIPTDRYAQLLAYGLVPGHWIKVLQHSPVTVVLVEHTEVALEDDLACEVLVEDMQPG
jgi:Fe2+ transport system protein FeoA